MTAQPGTGTTWDAGGYNDIDSRLVERGGLQAVLVRDYRGADTDIIVAAAKAYMNALNRLIAIQREDGA